MSTHKNLASYFHWTISCKSLVKHPTFVAETMKHYILEQFCRKLLYDCLYVILSHCDNERLSSVIRYLDGHWTMGLLSMWNSKMPLFAWMDLQLFISVSTFFILNSLKFFILNSLKLLTLISLKFDEKFPLNFYWRFPRHLIRRLT